MSRVDFAWLFTWIKSGCNWRGSWVFLALSLAAIAMATSPVMADISSDQISSVNASVTRVTIENASLPASGSHQTQFSVSRFGRYSVAARSRQGIAIQLVDRQAGPGAWVGQAAEKDGRIDAFLERGEYRIRTRGAVRNSGEVKVDVRAFTEKHEKPPLLVEERIETSTLSDLQQRSYWVEVKASGAIYLEASGRYLEDMRLWRDGNWLVDAQPKKSVTMPHAGQPITVLQLDSTLPAGFYLLTTYGGAGQKWTNESSNNALQVQRGVSKLGSIGRQRFVVGQRGFDRWLVPKSTSYYRMELDKPGVASLSVSDFQPDYAARATTSKASLVKNARIPVAEIFNRHGEARYQVVTVTAEAGTPYIFEHFDLRSEYGIAVPGDYWVSTVNSGDVQDSIDATAIVTRGNKRNYRQEFLLDEAVRLGDKKRWQRRFNVLETTTLYVRIEKAGKYSVESQGVDLRLRLDPFDINRTMANRTVSYSARGKNIWDLLEGLYVLTIEPETLGIATVAIQAQDAANDAPTMNMSTPARANIRIPKFTVGNDDSYRIYFNRIPGVATGLLVRKLPIDLSESMPISIMPNDALTLPIFVPELGEIRVQTDDGNDFPFLLDKVSFGKSANVERGEKSLMLTAIGKETVPVTIIFTPTRLASNATPPPLPENAFTLPDFPVLSTQMAQYLDLGRRAEATFKVNVERPALYRIESTGLLSTRGVLRTRVNPSLFSVEGNGTGRNFLVQRYVREGDYQLTTSTTGETEGRLGVQLVANEVIDGGVLAEKRPSRITLPVGRAVAYQFTVRNPGEFKVSAIGLERDRVFRLEDAQGWPLDAPEFTGSVTRQFEPGNYRIIVLPTDLEARVLTQVESVPVASQRKGHGPFALSLDLGVEHIWEEPAKEQARKADQWEFTLPSRATVNAMLDGDMQGTVERVDGAGHAELPMIYADKTWRQELEKGRYRFNLQNRRMDNLVTYHLKVASDELLVGQSRQVSAPSDTLISIGADSFVEIFSGGSHDVVARLYDEHDRLIGRADDRVDDWNFLITTPLAAGRYRLTVDSVNGQAVATTVFIRAPRDRVEKAKAVPNQWIVNDDEMHVYPLTLPKDKNLVVIRARGLANVGLAIEQLTAQGWQAKGSRTGQNPRIELAVPAVPGNFRLRYWLTDGRRGPIELRAAATNVIPVQDAVLAQGMRGIVIEGSSVIAVQSKRGLMRLGNRTGTRATAGDGVLRDFGNDNLPVGDGLFWLSADAKDDLPVAFNAQRVSLTANAGKEYAVSVSNALPVAVDLDDSAGPLLVVARAKQALSIVQVLNRSDPSPDIDLNSVDITSGSTIAVSLKSSGARALLHNSSEYAAIDLGLQYFSFKATDAQRVSEGDAVKTVRAHSYSELKLPPGRNALDIALSANMAAVAVTGGKITATAWAGDDTRAIEWETFADSILLLNASAVDSRVLIKARPSIVAPTRLEINSAGVSVQHTFSKFGVEKIPVNVTGGVPLRLQVLGAQDVQFLGSNGRLLKGDELTLSTSGHLVVTHAATHVVLATESSAIQRTRGASLPAMRVPGQLKLAGAEMQVRLVAENISFYQIQIDTPFIARWTNGDREQITVHPFGGQLQRVARGEGRLTLQPYAATSLSGLMQVNIATATEIKEGVGEEVFLLGGDTRQFTFTLDQAATVGLGVRASDDVVSAQLLDGNGKTLAEGIVHLVDLKPGKYYLSVHAAGNLPPVRIQPVVIGLQPTPNSPPPTLIRQFLDSTVDTGLLSFSPPAKATEENSSADTVSVETQIESEQEDISEPENPEAVDQ